MLDTTFNQKKAEAFSESLVDALNKCAVGLAISFGHRTRLFDTMKNLPFSTSAQIAEAANLNERYVREWLGAMVTGRIVNYDEKTRICKLPEENAAFLNRNAAPKSLS